MTVTVPSFEYLLEEIGKRQSIVKEYLFIAENAPQLNYPHLKDAVLSYLKAGGKSLRPAVLMFCCGLMGGEERRAIPAAAAIELYHTFTLVHDDIIDQDELRRGVPTVHHDFAMRARADLGYEDATAKHYGLAIGILAGDIQQGWAASILTKLYSEFGCPPALALNIIHELFYRVQSYLIEGETLDIMQSQAPLDSVSEEDVLDMLWKKTGILYEFAGRAGAAIGLNSDTLYDERIEKIAQFTGKCGTAFQVQDDILGLVGNEKQLGKPIGSDIREGKRTVILLHTLPLMSEAERDLTRGVLGNPTASLADIERVTQIIRERGGVAYAQQKARTMVQEALTGLADVPDSPYKQLLISWANYMIERDF